MVNWLTGAVEHVRDHGGSLVKGGASALRRRAGALRTRLGIDDPAALEAQLERRAQDAAGSPLLGGGVAAREELCESWFRQLQASAGHAEGSSVSGSSRTAPSLTSAGLRTVLLRGKVLRPVLEAVARDHGSGGAYAGLPALRSLLKVLSDCPDAWHNEFVDLLLGDGHILGDAQVGWIVELAACSLADGADEAYKYEQQELTGSVERLLHELSQLEGGTADPENLTQVRRLACQRIDASASLFEACLVLRQTLEEAEAEHKSTSGTQTQILNHIAVASEEHGRTLRTSPSSMAGRQSTLQSQLREAYDSVQAQLQHFDVQRSEVEREIEALEGQKSEIARQLEDINRQLQFAQDGQRQHLRLIDEQRAAVSKNEDMFRARIKIEDEALARAAREHTIAQRTEVLVSRAQGVVQAAFVGQIAEVDRKQTQFGGLFQEILRDHLSVEIERAEQIRREAQACASIALEHKAKVEMLNIMDMSARNVIDPSMRGRLERVLQHAESARTAFADFMRDYGTIVEPSQESHLTRKLQTLHAEIESVLAPCLALLGRAALQPPITSSVVQLAPSAILASSPASESPILRLGVAPTARAPPPTPASASVAAITAVSCTAPPMTPAPPPAPVPGSSGMAAGTPGGGALLRPGGQAPPPPPPLPGSAAMLASLGHAAPKLVEAAVDSGGYVVSPARTFAPQPLAAQFSAAGGAPPDASALPIPAESVKATPVVGEARASDAACLRAAAPQPPAGAASPAVGLGVGAAGAPGQPTAAVL